MICQHEEIFKIKSTPPLDLTVPGRGTAQTLALLRGLNQQTQPSDAGATQRSLDEESSQSYSLKSSSCEDPHEAAPAQAPEDRLITDSSGVFSASPPPALKMPAKTYGEHTNCKACGVYVSKVRTFPVCL